MKAAKPSVSTRLQALLRPWTVRQARQTAEPLAAALCNRESPAIRNELAGPFNFSE